MMSIFLRSGFCQVALLFAAILAGAMVSAEETRAVTAALHLSPVQAKPGDVVELQLKLTVNAPWYVYGQRPGDGGQLPMNMRLKLPEGVQTIGGWIWPEAGAILTAGEHVFTHKLHVAALSEAAEVKLILSFQACNAQLCLPMEMVGLDATLEAQDAPGKSSERQSCSRH